MSEPEILIYSPVPGEAAAYADLLRLAVPEVPLHQATTPAEVGSAKEKASVVLGWKFPPGLISDMPSLRWVHKVSAGVEDLLPVLVHRPDLLVSRTDGSAIAPRMVEYVLGGIYSTTQKFPRAWSQANNKVWESYLVGRASGKTVGVAGLGDIGSRIAKALSQNGMSVVGWRRSDGEVPEGVQKVFRGRNAFLEFLSVSDFVVSVLPSTEETNDVFDAAAFRAMKPEAVLINVGRGNCVDEDALAEALTNGTIAGAVLDVVKVEPLPSDSKLWGLRNLMLTPHVSGPIVPEDVISFFLNNFTRFRTGRPLHKTVQADRGY